MNKTRAAASAIVGLALTATGVLAAVPQSQAPVTAVAVSTMAQDSAAVGGSNQNHGGAVSTLARGTHGAPETTTTTTTTAEVGAQGEHGAAVSVVAQDETLVGGPNANHGGAVSIVAQGTTGTTSATVTHGKSAGKSQAGNHPVAH